MFIFTEYPEKKMTERSVAYFATNWLTVSYEKDTSKTHKVTTSFIQSIPSYSSDCKDETIEINKETRGRYQKEVCKIFDIFRSI